MVDSLVFFDDNIVLGSLASGEYSKVDHYAVEWFEVHADGSWAAVLSERKIVCMWPHTNIASRLITIGSPTACSVTASCSQLNTPSACTQCVLNEPWCRLSSTFSYDKLFGLVAFGGLRWEAMKYISQNSSSMTPNGFTGPIGNNATFFSGFRLSNSSPTKEEIMGSGPNSAGPQVLGSIQNLVDLSTKIENWSRSGQIDTSAAAAARLAALEATRRTPSSGEPDCCSAVDIRYLDGTVCCSSGDECVYFNVGTAARPRGYCESPALFQTVTLTIPDSYAIPPEGLLIAINLGSDDIVKFNGSRFGGSGCVQDGYINTEIRVFTNTFTIEFFDTQGGAVGGGGSICIKGCKHSSGPPKRLYFSYAGGDVQGDLNGWKASLSGAPGGNGISNFIEAS
jgi:hypothetical protein